MSISRMSSPQSGALEVSDLTTGYGDVRIVHGVSLTATLGAITVVIGPNGSGKSTLMRCIAGLLPVHSGAIHIHGKDLTELGVQDRLRRGLAFVPQEHTVFPQLTVGENLRLGGWLWRRESDPRSSEYVYEILPSLKPLARRAAGQLSGGQQRLVEIGRALMARPEIVVLDEPTADLSPKLTTYLYEHLSGVVRQGGVGVLLVEQNVREALEVADYVYALAGGRPDAQGTADEIRQSLDEIVKRWLFGPGHDATFQREPQ